MFHVNYHFLTSRVVIDLVYVMWVMKYNNPPTGVISPTSSIGHVPGPDIPFDFNQRALEMRENQSIQTI